METTGRKHIDQNNPAYWLRYYARMAEINGDEVKYERLEEAADLIDLQSKAIHELLSSHDVMWMHYIDLRREHEALKDGIKTSTIEVK